jgi:hypothetical protein
MRRTVIHSALAVALILSSGVQGCKQKAKAPESPRIVSLVIEPSALDAGKNYALLLKADELTANDAAVLYSEAAQALPAEIDVAVADGRKMPLSQLPQARIQAVLQQAQASLDLVGQGSLQKRHLAPVRARNPAGEPHRVPSACVPAVRQSPAGDRPGAI